MNMGTQANPYWVEVTTGSTLSIAAEYSGDTLRAVVTYSGKGGILCSTILGGTSATMADATVATLEMRDENSGSHKFGAFPEPDSPASESGSGWRLGPTVIQEI